MKIGVQEIDTAVISIKYNHIKLINQEMLDSFDRDFAEFVAKYEWLEKEVQWCDSNWTFDGG